MQYIYGKDFNIDNTCVAFGQFDGLHRGHGAVIDKLIDQEEKNLTSVLLSFDYNPTDIFGINNVIYTEEEKQIILGKNAPQVMISYPFTSEMANMEPEEFIKNILVNKLGVKVIVTGENCEFGKGCTGNIETLKNLASKYGYKVICVETVKEEGKAITCDVIRKAFDEGLLDKVNKLLGHTFTMIGEVVHGKALGRTVGMPTANLAVPDNKLIPMHGVYATLSEIEQDMVQGLTNIGKRPSVDDHSYVTIETFLLDFCKNIYGQKIALEVHSYIRGVRKFNNVEEVKNQVDKDIESIREYLNSVQCVI
jgi:riboflavin kinase/FMN adenylyltransferase